MKKALVVIVALVLALIALRPVIVEHVVLPLPLRSSGIKDTKDSSDYERELSKIAPRGTDLRVKEMTSLDKVSATIILPENTSKEEVKAFLDKAQPVIEEQAGKKETKTNVHAELDGKKVIFSHEERTPPLSEQWSKSEALLPQMGDKADTMMFYLEYITLSDNKEYSSGAECAKALSAKQGILAGEFTSISTLKCNGAHVSLDKSDKADEYMKDFAAIMEKLPGIPEKTSISIRENGSLFIHKEKDLPAEAKSALEAWPHGETKTYNK